MTGFGSGSFVAASGFFEATFSGFLSTFWVVSAFEPEDARLESPSRCTLPITALRVTPPSSLAI